MAVENRIIGKLNGRDIRADMIVSPDGTTIFDRGACEVEQYDRMLKRIEPGERFFCNYPYLVTILPSEVTLFHVSQDAVGNKSVLAEVYLLGDHYRHGIGERISSEDSWSVKKDEDGNVITDEYGNPLKEEETRSFVLFSTTPFNPSVVHARFLTRSNHTSEFDQAKQVYDLVTKNEVHMRKMKKIASDVHTLREWRMTVLKGETNSDSIA